MRLTHPTEPQFYVTAPQPCPYLADRIERKLFTALSGPEAQNINDTLSKQGFRRSQNVLYRPSCSECAACLSARINVAAFMPSKSQRRCIRRNRELRRSVLSPWATDEQFELFQWYLEARHASGGMADMDMFEFAAMVEETPVSTRVMEYRKTGTGRLEGVCLSDFFDDGLSLVYSFFRPDERQLSLGTFIVLDHIAIARELGLPYVYLGYWVPGSPKMHYKSMFSGLEVYREGIWEKVRDPADFGTCVEPLCTSSISEQVANIRLPDK